EAADSFSRLLTGYPDAAGESGLPLRPLAELKLFKLRSITNLSMPISLTVESLCSNAVCNPTPLSAGILQRVSAEARSNEERKAVREWARLWQEQESLRALFSAVSPRFFERAQGELLLSGRSNAEREQDLVTAGSNSPPRSSTPAVPLHGLYWFRPPLRWNQ